MESFNKPRIYISLVTYIFLSVSFGQTKKLKNGEKGKFQFFFLCFAKKMPYLPLDKDKKKRKDRKQKQTERKLSPFCWRKWKPTQELPGKTI